MDAPIPRIRGFFQFNLSGGVLSKTARATYSGISVQTGIYISYGVNLSRYTNVGITFPCRGGLGIIGALSLPKVYRNNLSGQTVFGVNFQKQCCHHNI